MSVTFSLRNGKDIDGPYGPEPEFYLNCHNVGARELLRLIGIDVGDDLYGSIEGESLSTTIKRAMKALNNTRADYTRHPHEHPPIINAARVIDCGSPDEIMRIRLRKYIELASEAHRTNDFIVFG